MNGTVLRVCLYGIFSRKKTHRAYYQEKNNGGKHCLKLNFAHNWSSLQRIDPQETLLHPMNKNFATSCILINLLFISVMCHNSEHRIQKNFKLLTARYCPQVFVHHMVGVKAFLHAIFWFYQEV